MIYLDNSATTNPKPQAVKNAVIRAMNYYSFNSGRGGYKESVNTSDMIFPAVKSFQKCSAFRLKILPLHQIAPRQLILR